MIPKICVVLVVRDEEFFLPLTLSSVRQYADHVFVLDTGSVDRTMEILRTSGVTYEQKDFGGAYRFDGGSYTGGKGATGKGPYREMEARNYALDRASELFRPDWILRMDADESFHYSLFEAMRNEREMDAMGFGCEMPVGFSPMRLSRLPDSMRTWSGVSLHDPHVFAWRESKHRVRWMHPERQHVCLHGLPPSRVISYPVQFHYHRVFGPKSIYTYLYWERSFAGENLPYGAITWLQNEEITPMNFRDDAIYRKLMPERFDAQGRFKVPKIVVDYFKKDSVITPNKPDQQIVDAWKKFIIYEE